MTIVKFSWNFGDVKVGTRKKVKILLDEGLEQIHDMNFFFWKLERNEVIVWNTN